jgi:hypothetical protein
LIYDPRARQDLPLGEWWLIIVCCTDLARYYRAFFNWEYRARYQILKTAWDSHISIIRGEEPKYKEFWREKQGQSITFYYTGEIKTNDIYCWLEIFCPEALDIREKMGLPREPVFPLHLTLGKRLGWQEETEL